MEHGKAHAMKRVLVNSVNIVNSRQDSARNAKSVIGVKAVTTPVKIKTVKDLRVRAHNLLA